MAVYSVSGDLSLRPFSVTELTSGSTLPRILINVDSHWYDIPVELLPNFFSTIPSWLGTEELMIKKACAGLLGVGPNSPNPKAL